MQTANASERIIAWEDHGNNKWSANAPGGFALWYSGPNFNIWDRSENRFTHNLSVEVRGKAPAMLCREGSFDQFAKWAGYAVEHQTGDTEFDRMIYLGTDSVLAAEHLTLRSDLRQAVLHIFEGGAKVVRMGPTSLWADLRSLRSPQDDDGHDLTLMALKLCGLAKLWPEVSPLQQLTSKSGGWLNRRTVSLAWCGLVISTVLARFFWGGDEAWERQIETFAGPDWLGMGLLAVIGIAPLAILGGKRATSHHVLAAAVAATLAVLPASEHFLQIDLNKLRTANEQLEPATLTELRPDGDGLHRDGYEVMVSSADRLTEWELTKAEGDLALQGKLCLASVIAEGARGLRYVKTVRTWTCRNGETGQQPLPS